MASQQTRARYEVRRGGLTVCPVNDVRYRDFDALTLETLGLQSNKPRGKRGEVCESHGNHQETLMIP